MTITCKLYFGEGENIYEQEMKISVKNIQILKIL